MQSTIRSSPKTFSASSRKDFCYYHSIHTKQRVRACMAVWHQHNTQSAAIQWLRKMELPRLLFKSLLSKEENGEYGGREGVREGGREGDCFSMTLGTVPQNMKTQMTAQWKEYPHSKKKMLSQPSLPILENDFHYELSGRSSILTNKISEFHEEKREVIL